MARRRTEKKPRGGAPGRQRRQTWNWRLVGFLATVLAVKIAIVFQLQDHPLLQPEGGLDTAAYLRLARQVANGDLALGPGLYFLSPLYIYFLAGVLTIADSLTVVRFVQAILGTVAVGCVFLTARAWYGERAGWIAAGLAALTGVFTFYEALILQSALDPILTAAALWCLTSAFRLRAEATGDQSGARRDQFPLKAEATRDQSGTTRDQSGTTRDQPGPTRDQPGPTSDHVASAFRRNILIAGLLFGLQILNRPNVLVAVAGIVLVLLFARRMRTAALLTAGVLVALSPIVIRNAVVSRQFALSSSQGGLNFYIGNHAAATGQYVEVPGVRANIEGQSEDTRKVAEGAAGRALTDAQVSAHFSGLATQWIRANPGAAAKLFAKKLALVFNARHQWLDFSYPYYAYDAGTSLWLLFVGPWLLVPVGVAGLIAAPPSPGRGFGGTGYMRDRAYITWTCFVPFYAIGVAVFFVGERYRLPLFVPLCVSAGGAVDRMLQAFWQRTSDLGPRTSIPAAVFAILMTAAVTFWPFTLEDGRFEERLRLSKVLMNRGDYGMAAMELGRAHAIEPSHTIAEFNLGMALISSGRAAEGIAHARRAVDAGVEMPGARYALAGAMMQTGDRDGAARVLRAATPAPDDSADSCYRVALLALDAGAPDVAERYLRHALTLRPGWTDASELLAQVRERRF